MSTKLIAAHTNFEPSYPGYINFTREEDGRVTVFFRGNPSTREGCYICGAARYKGHPGRCTPGDEHCNNYCNLAPEKGPMQKHPLPCTHTDEGATGQLTLSADAFSSLMAAINTNSRLNKLADMGFADAAEFARNPNEYP